MTTSSLSYTKVLAPELRSWAPFVRKDALRAGDILLTRGESRESTVIAWMTCGRYSHAAIFLPSKVGDAVHLDLVEADDHGVGAAPTRSVWIKFEGGYHEVIRLPGESPPKGAVLLRHPTLKAVDASTLDQATTRFANVELNRRYPSLDRLVGPLPLPVPVKRLLGCVVSKYLEKAEHEKAERLVLTGSFCSELVAKFFLSLGIPILGNEVVPESISPNHLWRSCALKRVPDAFISAADLPDDAYAEVHEVFRWDMRKRYLGHIVRCNEATSLLLPEVKKEIEQANELVELAHKVLKLDSDLWNAVLQKSLHKLGSINSLARSWENKFGSNAARLLDLSEQMEAITRKILSVVPNDSTRAQRWLCLHRDIIHNSVLCEHLVRMVPEIGDTAQSIARIDPHYFAVHKRGESPMWASSDERRIFFRWILLQNRATSSTTAVNLRLQRRFTLDDVRLRGIAETANDHSERRRKSLATYCQSRAVGCKLLAEMSEFLANVNDKWLSDPEWANATDEISHLVTASLEDADKRLLSCLAACPT